MLKLSRYTSNTSKILCKLLPQYLDTTAFAVEGGKNKFKI